MPMMHHLTLNERQHPIATSKAEEPNLEERDEEVEKYHSVGFIKVP